MKTTDVKKVAIALSGGIDSLVAGYLLKQDYPDVFGIHFSSGYQKKDFDLSSVAEQLDIKIKHVDLSSLFENKIVNYFINTYLSGKTPNPCILCNKRIKFGALLDSAKSFGADALATGHYAQVEKHETHYALKKGEDSKKDQSYFLSLLSESTLKNIIFPLGGMTKENVKKFALKKLLTPVEKKESQDICFLNKNESIAQFIHSKVDIGLNPGDIVTSNGEIIGTHKGLYNFTIGQRRGINCPSSEPYYVKTLDTDNNSLIVCYKNELLTQDLSVTSLNWIRKDISFPLSVTTKIRYNHPQSASTLTETNNSNVINVKFEEKQFAVTPGQTAVFYDNDIIIGSGIII
ncbi:MAG: tRNA 2-thiouridine(34) synthase MnmA [Desulfobacteraceae bacterium]|nr:tRNA 2-thiouridine(34) synthase MnmA [Desulfobacteraceae bacterium]